MFNKILLAADGSEHSLHAAEEALFLAKNSSKAHIEVAYVVDGSTSKSDVLSSWDSMDVKERRKEKINSIEKLLTQAEISYEVKILHGEPGPTIVQYANDNKFDIVIIGSRGLSTVKEVFLGSVSHKVAQKAICPVLIVK